MIRPKKILWIEEETLSMMASYRAYIDASLDYELNVIDNLEEAIEFIPQLDNFYKIILDIRIYENRTNTFDSKNHHGLEFLKQVKIVNNDYFNKIVILTNEHKGALDLKTLGFPESQYFSKGAIRSTIMLQEKILK